MLSATLLSFVILLRMVKKYKTRSVQEIRNAIFQNLLTATVAALLFLIFNTSLFESLAMRLGIQSNTFINLKKGSLVVAEMFCFSALGIWIALKKQNRS